MRWNNLINVPLIGLILVAATLTSAGAADIYVSILPQAFFAERLVQDSHSVGVLVGPGQSPHTFEPTPRQIAQMSEAKLFFTVGMPFEQRLIEKIGSINAGITVVDTLEGIPLREVNADEKDSHDHGHHSGLPDPHVWLNPRLAGIQAGTMCRALKTMDPAHADMFQANLEVLLKDLDRLDRELSETLASLRGREFLVFHPSFGYFADAYGLKQVAVEIEGKEPTAKQLAELIDRARAVNAGIVFVQPQFSSKSAKAVADSIGGSVVAIDPLSKGYIDNLHQIAVRIREGLVMDHERRNR